MHGAASTRETDQLDQLTRAVQDLQRRVAALERGGAPGASTAGPSDVSGAVPVFEGPALPSVSSGLVPALGRLLLGIGGAYLLRVVAEAHILPEWAGTALGLAYGGAWLVSSARVSADRRLSAVFDAITASCILAPLVWEATVRFHTLTPLASAAVLTLFIIVGQLAGWLRGHSAVGGIAAMVGCATAVALIVGTLDPLPFAAGLTVAAAVVEYGAFRGRALQWRWIIAVTADCSAFLLIYLVSRPQGLPQGYAPIASNPVVVLLIGLGLTYLASMAARTAFLGSVVNWFDLLQVPIILALVITGLAALGSGVVMAGIGCLALSTACYGTALLRFEHSFSRNFQTYATFGLLLGVSGGLLLFSRPAFAAVSGAFAILAVFVARRMHAGALVAHGAVYLMAAAEESGLLRYTARVFMGANLPFAFTNGWMICTIAAALCYLLTLGFVKNRIAPALFLAFLCWSLAALAAGAWALFSIDNRMASTMHTAIISVFAIALAWAGRQWRRPEMVWVLVPWMIFGGVSLVAEHLRQGRPATLFLPLFMYGGTLIALPRLLRTKTNPGILARQSKY